jgi:hypothetical protein
LNISGYTGLSWRQCSRPVDYGVGPLQSA